MIDTVDILAKSARLPLTMSQPVVAGCKALERGDYKESLIRILDFFEMSVQWLNCYMLSLAASNHITGVGVENAVKMIDRKRPLSFGDNVNEIFNPLLDALYRVIPEHPLLLGLTTNVKTKKRDIIVGSVKESGS